MTASARLTILPGAEINDISNADIDDAEESLILLLELLLVKYLYRQYALLRGAPISLSVGV